MKLAAITEGSVQHPNVLFLNVFVTRQHIIDLRNIEHIVGWARIFITTPGKSQPKTARMIVHRHLTSASTTKLIAFMLDHETGNLIHYLLLREQQFSMTCISLLNDPNLAMHSCL